MSKQKRRLSLDWIAVLTALLIAALAKVQLLPYIPW